MANPNPKVSHRGSTPKPPEERRNRAQPSKGEWIDLPEPGTFKLVLPPLPKKIPGLNEPWPALTKKAYESWRQDPASSQLSGSDVQYVLETAIVHAFWTVEQHKHEKALTARLDKLGFTPKGKRDLRYRLPQYVVAQEEAESKKKTGKASRDRRARLTVHEGGRDN